MWRRHELLPSAGSGKRTAGWVWNALRENDLPPMIPSSSPFVIVAGLFGYFSSLNDSSRCAQPNPNCCALTHR